MESIIKTERTADDLVVIASDVQEMERAQVSTIEIVRTKEIAAQHELYEAQEMLAHAKKCKFSPKAAATLVKKAESRILYLGKIREALEAGFVPVPNFPARTIGIRVKRAAPRRMQTEVRNYAHDADSPSAELLPAGEGRYVAGDNHLQRQYKQTVTDSNGKESVKHYTVLTGFMEEIDFPVDFLKPVVIQRTSAAMAKKIFDEIAITQDTSWPRKADPMVIGRILDRKNHRFISFLIAWFLDTKDI